MFAEFWTKKQLTTPFFSNYTDQNSAHIIIVSTFNICFYMMKYSFKEFTAPQADYLAQFEIRKKEPILCFEYGMG